MTRQRSATASIAIFAWLAVAGATGCESARSAEGGEKIRGITLSTHGSGLDWGGDTIGPTFDEFGKVGAGWVATHPYAGIAADGTVRFRPSDPARPPQHVVRPIGEAHARGLKILIKPHLAYWGSPFSWRGEIRFDTEEAWDRFFDTYEAWIVDLARAARDADGFAIGTELDNTLEHEGRWRRIIARVREVTDAPLTYAANWPDYRRVPFWDSLDAVGIQAYFPIADAPTSDPELLRRGWSRVMRDLRTFSERVERPVVFTELGYNRAYAAAVEPWAYRTDGPEAESVQSACLEAALRAVEHEPSVVGVFLWKWFPNPRPVGRNFQLATPAIKKTIADVWRPTGPKPGG